jgi:hypothetical protein
MAQPGASSVETRLVATRVQLAPQQNSLTETPASLPHIPEMENAETRTENSTALAGMASPAAHGVISVDMGNTDALSVQANSTVLKHAPLPDFLLIVTPLIADAWEWELRVHEVYHTFSDVPYSIKHGFDMGVYSVIHETYTPPNHKSALDNPTVVETHITKERTTGRYTGPFSKSRLEQLIGPFRSSPLGTVPKSDTPGDFRIIQDLSFPRNNTLHFSVNSEIDAACFPCDWGTFSEICDIIRNAPTGLQGATMDVDSAFRCCPITPSQQNHFIVGWNELYYIDHNAPFGAVSSGGVFGRLADAMTAIIRALSKTDCKNWVDDFIIFRLPDNITPPIYSFDLDDLTELAKRLGWPWKPSKTRPFSHSFRYLGFQWDVILRTVVIPSEKAQRYIQKIRHWIEQPSSSRKEAESVHGTLVHCSLALPDGRSHLPSISQFAASFQEKSTFSRRKPNQTVHADINWWIAELSQVSPGSKILSPPPLSPVQFWVDASTSFGIGVVFDDKWDAWRLLPNWDSDPRHKIGWAEIVAIECGLRLATHLGYSNIHFQVKSDNTGVIGAIKGGRSRNPAHNKVLQRITALLRTHSLWISSLYVPSEHNIADKPSRGIPPPGYSQSKDTFNIPDFLTPYLERI